MGKKQGESFFVMFRKGDPTQQFSTVDNLSFFSRPITFFSGEKRNGSPPKKKRAAKHRLWDWHGVVILNLRGCTVLVLLGYYAYIRRRSHLNWPYLLTRPQWPPVLLTTTFCAGTMAA